MAGAMRLPVTSTGTAVTKHGWARMCGRRISLEAVNAAMAFGRVIHGKGAVFYVIGRREVTDALRRLGVNLSKFEGVHVVCSKDDESVITVYRNRNLKQAWNWR